MHSTHGVAHYKKTPTRETELTFDSSVFTVTRLPKTPLKKDSQLEKWPFSQKKQTMKQVKIWSLSQIF